MLRLQRQGPWECLPTTVAMLCNVDKREILAEWETMAGTTFKVNPAGAVFWPMALRLLASRFGPDVAKAYETMKDLANDRLRVYRKGMEGSVVAGETTIPTKGRGLLQLLYTDTQHTQRHSVAYCDGLIYNPDGDTPCTWEEYQKTHPGWVLEGVIETTP